MRIIIVLTSLLLLSCDDSTSGPPTPAAHQGRELSAPAVPEHPRRAELIGEWQSDGESVFSIERVDENHVVIRSIQDPPWDSVINNVRWDGETLHFDIYMYYTGPEDFSTINNPSGAHPYSGVRNESSLEFTNDPNRLKHEISIKDLPAPI